LQPAAGCDFTHIPRFNPQTKVLGSTLGGKVALHLYVILITEFALFPGLHLDVN
jgi:hypothetical protein